MSLPAGVPLALALAVALGWALPLAEAVALGEGQKVRVGRGEEERLEEGVGDCVREAPPPPPPPRPGEGEAEGQREALGQAETLGEPVPPHCEALGEPVGAGVRRAEALLVPWRRTVAEGTAVRDGEAAGLRVAREGEGEAESWGEGEGLAGAVAAAEQLGLRERLEGTVSASAALPRARLAEGKRARVRGPASPAASASVLPPATAAESERAATAGQALALDCRGATLYSPTAAALPLAGCAYQHPLPQRRARDSAAGPTLVGEPRSPGACSRVAAEALRLPGGARAMGKGAAAPTEKSRRTPARGYSAADAATQPLFTSTCAGPQAGAVVAVTPVSRHTRAARSMERSASRPPSGAPRRGRFASAARGAERGAIWEAPVGSRGERRFKGAKRIALTQRAGKKISGHALDH